MQTSSHKSQPPKIKPKQEISHKTPTPKIKPNQEILTETCTYYLWKIECTCIRKKKKIPRVDILAVKRRSKTTRALSGHGRWDDGQIKNMEIFCVGTTSLSLSSLFVGAGRPVSLLCSFYWVWMIELVFKSQVTLTWLFR